MMERIACDPDILGGKPVIAGTRLPVTLILNLLRHGYDEAKIIDAYPNLRVDDIRAALHFAEQYVGAHPRQLAETR